MQFFQQKNQSIKRSILPLIYLISFFMLTGTLVHAQDQPAYGTAIIDGSDAEWNPVLDYFADMHHAWNKPTVLSTLYMRYDCLTETMYVLVLAEEAGTLDASEAEESWIKIDGNKAVDDTYTSFAYIGLSGDWADGWEASFPLSPGTYTVSAHSNVYYVKEKDGEIEAEVETSGLSGKDILIECQVQYDYGDAPGEDDPFFPYATAGQAVSSTMIVRLGTVVDTEESHIGDHAAVSDDDDNANNDEDGIVFYRKTQQDTWEAMQNNIVFVRDQDYRVDVTVTLGPGISARLAGWVDFITDNRVFGDHDGELIIDNVVLTNNTTQTQTTVHTFYFTAPTGTPDAGISFARFRLDSDISYGDLSPSGLGSGYGEVEDYAVSFSDTPPVAITLTFFKATRGSDRVELCWEVQSEINHAGYNVHRSTSRDGEYEQLNTSLITSDVLTDMASVKTYEYIDDTAIAQQDYYYKLEDISLNGKSTWHGPVYVSMALDVAGQTETVNEYKLVGNYPNPFNPSTTIEYTIANSVYVELTVYSMTGQRVAMLVSTEQSAGRYRIPWNAVDDHNQPVSSGSYIYRLSAGDFSKTGRMLFLK